MGLTDLISHLADEFCCDKTLVQQLTSLATSSNPSFAYIYDVQTTDNTRCMLLHLLNQLLSSGAGVNVAHAFINCVACFSQRLLFDTTLNSLMKHRSEFSDGFRLWKDGALDSGNWNDSLDGFLHGLNACYAELSQSGSGADEMGASVATKIVLVFENPGKLKETLPGFIMPLARLHELVICTVICYFTRLKVLEQAKANITTIFLGDTEWENITPHAGTLPDPYRITVQTPNKEGEIPPRRSLHP